MLYFPQLATGSAAQYPVRKQVRGRTVESRLADGRTVKWLDTGFIETRWHLTLRQLSLEEKAALGEFFRTVEGSLRSFTFADPTANLLKWSERMTEAVWERDPLLQVTEGAADPRGGEGAVMLTNIGAAPQKIVQVLPLPAGYQCCFSLWARSATETEFKMRRVCGTLQQETRQTASQEWRHYTSAGVLGGAGEGIGFEIEVGLNSGICVCGAQVEAGQGATEYKRTSARNGIHTQTRFEQDTMVCAGWGPDDYEVQVRLISKQ
jgi:hypothetical protein